MKKKSKKDLLLIVLVLAIAAAGAFINFMMHQKPAALVEVQVDGKVVASYDLNKDADIVVDGYQGGTNHLIIQDGMVWISEATCPDKICVHQGKISLNGDMIVCLPNRMIAMVTEPE